jgi:Uma2 family endonuclease
MTTRERIPVEDFDQMVHLPENADKRLEYVGGEIYELVSNDIAAKITGLIHGYLFVYLLKNKIGWLSSAEGGFMVMGERYVPDVAFLAYETQPETTGVAYRPIPPDLAVEVVSSERSDENRNLNIKVSNFVAAGTVVWVVRPESKTVEVHAPGQAVKVLHMGDSVSGGDVLPDFTLKLSDIFAD